MKKILLLTALLLAAPCFALEDSPANRAREADRYLAATPPKDLIAEMVTQIAKTMPAENRQSFEQGFAKSLDVATLAKAMKDAMVRTFTADELKALADFYSSPIGKSAMKKMGSYMSEVMPTLQGEMMKVLGSMKP